jgi:hypothetical protein
MTGTQPDKTLSKFRRERALGRYLLNPTIAVLAKLGCAPPWPPNWRPPAARPARCGGSPFPPSSTPPAPG